MNKKPLTKKNIINLFKNQKIINLDTEWLDIKYSKERILAKDVISKINLPPFNNSAVDGYAILNSDLKNKEVLFCKRKIGSLIELSSSTNFLHISVRCFSSFTSSI